MKTLAWTVPSATGSSSVIVTSTVAVEPLMLQTPSIETGAIPPVSVIRARYFVR